MIDESIIYKGERCFFPEKECEECSYRWADMCVLEEVEEMAKDKGKKKPRGGCK